MELWLWQRKEEGATKREKPVRKLWGSIKKLNLNSGESEAGDEKKSVRRRFRSWRCCQTWTLRKEESAIKKSRQSDRSVRRRWMKLWGSRRKPRKERISKKRQKISFLNLTQSREEIEGVDCGRKPRKKRFSQKKEKRSVFWITPSLCPLLTPFWTPQSPHKSNDHFSAHFKIAINYFYL